MLRGYKDGLGNASHVGVVTGAGKGVIHASASRGCVCESEFKGKTIPNGGWNRVGLMKQLDYGAVGARDGDGASRRGNLREDSRPHNALPS